MKKQIDELDTVKGICMMLESTLSIIIPNRFGCASAYSGAFVLPPSGSDEVHDAALLWHALGLGR